MLSSVVPTFVKTPGKPLPSLVPSGRLVAANGPMGVIKVQQLQPPFVERPKKSQAVGC